MGAFSLSITPLRPWASAVLSGLLLALSFPKPGFSILAWLAFLPLFYAVRGQSPINSFKLGFLSGFVAYVSVFYWLNIVMTKYGNLPFTVSLALTMLLAAYLALYVAAAICLTRFAEDISISPLISFPILWVALEYIRAHALTGFPWASLGYTQYRTLPLIQIADITSVYGVSFLIGLLNVFLFQLWRWVRGKDGATCPFIATAAAVSLLLLTLLYGFISLNRDDTGKEVKVALAQGNIPQDVKWNPLFLEETVAIYERLSRKTAGTATQLIVWPESSLPFYFERESEYSGRVNSLARELDSYLIVSSPVLEYEDGKDRLLNSAFLISSDGTTAGRSDKIHLVPFGEYVPLAKLFPFVEKMVQGIGDFSPGKTATPLSAPFGKMGLLVCFESIFPEISRDYVRNGAGLLVNITNDAWFGYSSAPYQHLSMTVFRAVENRVPLVRSANTGITAFIDSRGHVQSMTRLFREALLSGNVRMGTEQSFYTTYGDIFALICCTISLAVMGIAYSRSLKQVQIS